MTSRCAAPSSCTGDPSSRPSSPLTWWGSDELLLRADDRLRSAAYEACQSSATGERPELGRRSTMLRLRLTAPSPDPLRCSARSREGTPDANTLMERRTSRASSSEAPSHTSMRRCSSFFRR